MQTHWASVWRCSTRHTSEDQEQKKKTTDLTAHPSQQAKQSSLI